MIKKSLFPLFTLLILNHLSLPYYCIDLNSTDLQVLTKKLILKKLYDIVYVGSQSAGWFPSPKGGGAMSTYKEMSIILGVAMLIVTILIYVNGNNGTKK